MPAPILHRDLWPTVGHLVHTIATQVGRNVVYFLEYHSAMYTQGMTFKYGLGGRLTLPQPLAQAYQSINVINTGQLYPETFIPH